ncbi:MAG: SGNH/GDSL hydrolase family protein [Clostridia bacterium]|nr:SGNH/GDSL hydrolase family protein [Clostridia bacterium]
MKNVPYNITMANFGTSHGLSCFRYPENDKSKFNFALSGEDIYHDFATLKQFTSHLEKGCIVAIPTSYFSFCMSTDEPSQKRYYIYLDRKYIRGFSFESLINAKYIPVLRSGEFIIKDLIKDQERDIGAEMMDNAAADKESTESLTAVTGNIPAQSESGNSDAQLVAHAKGRAESWRSGYMVAGKIYIEKNTQLLIEMVNYCYDMGFKPLLVTTPVYYALNERFDESEINECYYEPINRVVEATGVPYLDLSHDSELSANPDYYSNSDHMNSAGAEAFFERYTEFLSEIGYSAG